MDVGKGGVHETRFTPERILEGHYTKHTQRNNRGNLRYDSRITPNSLGGLALKRENEKPIKKHHLVD